MGIPAEIRGTGVPPRAVPPKNHEPLPAEKVPQYCSTGRRNTAIIRDTAKQLPPAGPPNSSSGRMAKPAILLFIPCFSSACYLSGVVLSNLGKKMT